jgi:membrane-associated protease RseP (regulator of RpoE activity)
MRRELVPKAKSIPGRGLAAVAAIALGLLAAVGPAKGDDVVVRVAENRETRPPREVRVFVPGKKEAMLLEAGRRGYLGVHVLELTPELRRHFSADDASGVLVSKVEDGSPAAQAGVAVGDVLVAVDGEDIDGSWDLRRVVAPRKQGDVVSVEVVRAGRAMELSATLADREGRLLELGSLMQRDGEGRPMIVLPSGGEWEMFGARMGQLGEEMGAIGEEVGEAVGEAVAEAMADPDLRVRIDRELQQREAMERQIERLEKRLKELERRLADQNR